MCCHCEDSVCFLPWAAPKVTLLWSVGSAFRCRGWLLYFHRTLALCDTLCQIQPENLNLSLGVSSNLHTFTLFSTSTWEFYISRYFHFKNRLRFSEVYLDFILTVRWSGPYCFFHKIIPGNQKLGISVFAQQIKTMMFIVTMMFECMLERRCNNRKKRTFRKIELFCSEF